MRRLALALALLFVPSFAVAKDTLHALIVVDSDDPKIGKAVALDGKLMMSLLKDGFADKAERLSAQVIEGKDCTFAGVRTALAGIPKLEDSDSLLVVFSCHGGYLPARELHLLAIGKRDLVMRDDLLQAMKAKGGRFQMLITDACATFPRPVASKGALDIKPEWEAMESLFFTPTGTLDLNACAVGQESFCDRDGSFFIRALCEQVRKPLKEQLRTDATQLRWQDILPDVQASVRKKYQQMLADMKAWIDGLPEGYARYRPQATYEKFSKQGDQTLGVWAVPPSDGLRPDANGLVYLPRRNKARGVEVLAVGLKPAPLATADVVLSVNGKKTPTVGVLRQAFEKEGERTIEFTRTPSSEVKTATLPAAKK